MRVGSQSDSGEPVTPPDAEGADQLRYQRSEGLVTLAAVLRRIDLDALARLMIDSYYAEIESYRRIPRAVLDGRKLDVARSNLSLFLDLAEQQRDLVDGDLQTARAGARADARDGIPLDDLLQAYRIGGLVCWREVIPHGRPEEHFAAAAAGELYVRFAETMSTAVTEAYNDELALMGSREDRLQRALYEGLVCGETSERELRTLADELQFPLRASYVPFAAATPNGGAEGLARLLGSQGLLAPAEGERVTGLAPDEDAEQIVAASAATFAIGTPAQRSELGAALEDQRVLVDFGLQAGRAGAISQREFLIERCLVRGPWLGRLLERHLLAPLDEHDRDNGSELVATLETFVDVGLSRKAAARTLHIHRNTLDYRLEQISRLTELKLGQPQTARSTPWRATPTSPATSAPTRSRSPTGRSWRSCASATSALGPAAYDPMRPRIPTCAASAIDATA